MYLCTLTDMPLQLSRDPAPVSNRRSSCSRQDLKCRLENSEVACPGSKPLPSLDSKPFWREKSSPYHSPSPPEVLSKGTWADRLSRHEPQKLECESVRCWMRLCRVCFLLASLFWERITVRQEMNDANKFYVCSWTGTSWRIPTNIARIHIWYIHASTYAVQYGWQQLHYITLTLHCIALHCMHTYMHAHINVFSSWRMILYRRTCASRNECV